MKYSMRPMCRALAAWTGCLLMLSASWAFAADDGYHLDLPAPPPSPAPSSPSAPSSPPVTPVTDTMPTPQSAINIATPLTESNDNGLFGSLPDLGGPAYTITRDEENQVGQMIVTEIRNEHLLLDDPEVDEYLQNLGMRLASQAHDPEQQFHYRCFDDDEINSFATFGGNIFIFTGLILVTESESELAAVMAHETGHVVQRHMVREIQADSHISMGSLAAMLAGALIAVAAGGRNSGEGVEGALALAQATQMQRSINFTRSIEIEADWVGIHLLASAGFDPYAMAEVFERLGQFEGLEGNEIPALLQDHPVTPERIAAARARAAEFPRLPQYRESELYGFIKERVRVLAAPPEARMTLYYAELSARQALTPAERYGQALARIRGGQPALAIPALRALQAQYPDLILLYSALGQAYAAAGQQQAALTQFALAEQLFPRNVPLTVDYAQALMKFGRPAEAHAMLLDLFDNVEPTPPQIQLTAMAASQAGDNGDAYYYMGEYNLANGQLALANQELELALSVPHLSPIQRARFLARLEQVRTWMREQQAHRGG